MKILDFGENSYQSDLAFRFDCLSTRAITDFVLMLTTKNDIFTSVARTDAQGQVELSRGNGTASNPYFQLRLSAGGLVLWGGWHLPFEEWQKWRKLFLDDVAELLEGLPPAMVERVSNYYNVRVTSQQIKGVSELPAVRDLGARFLPEELLHRAGIASTMGDSNGNEEISWVIPALPPEATVAFVANRKNLDSTVPLIRALHDHATRSDDLAVKFYSTIVSPLLR